MLHSPVPWCVALGVVGEEKGKGDGVWAAWLVGSGAREAGPEKPMAGNPWCHGMGT